MYTTRSILYNVHYKIPATRKLLASPTLPTLASRSLARCLVFKFAVSPTSAIFTESRSNLKQIAKNGLSLKPVRYLFTVTRQSAYNLRQSDFSLPRFATVTYGKHSVRCLGPKFWSHLPAEERNCHSLEAFKSKIRKRDLSRFLKKLNVVIAIFAIFNQSFYIHVYTLFHYYYYHLKLCIYNGIYENVITSFWILQNVVEPRPKASVSPGGWLVNFEGGGAQSTMVVINSTGVGLTGNMHLGSL